MKINFGCGSNKLDGWVNHDIEVDITKPLPYDNNTIEAVFAEHVMEHVTPHQAFTFLEECHRILRPGGYCRITVPTIVTVATACPDDYLKFAATFGTEATRKGAVRGLIFNHGHLSMWDTPLLLACFQAIGFSVARPGKLYQSPYGCLEGHQKVIGEAFNNLESIVVEGYK